MAESIRERILQALADRLRTISQPAGYSMDIGTIRRAEVQIGTEQEPAPMPAINITDQDEESTPGYGYHQLAMTVLIETYAETCDDENHSVIDNQLLADIKRALWQRDDRLAALVDDIAYQGGTIAYPEAGADIVATEQRITLTYRESLGAPDQQPEL